MHHQEIHDVAYSFEGPFGKYDQFQLQRGLQVYTEVCSACHGMKQVAIRSLSDEGGPGLPEERSAIGLGHPGLSRPAEGVPRGQRRTEA